MYFFFFFQAEDGIRDHCVTGVQTCALPISVQSPISKSIGPGFDRPLCRQPNRSPYAGDYRDCVSEIKRNFRHFARLPRAPAACFAVPRSQRMVGPANPKRNREWGSRLTGLDLGQRDALLSLVLPAAVFVGGLADFVGFDEDDLGHALVGVDLG